MLGATVRFYGTNSADLGGASETDAAHLKTEPTVAARTAELQAGNRCQMFLG